VAEPRVHLGNYYEIDVSTFEQDEDSVPKLGPARESSSGISTATQALPAPTLTFDADFPEQYAHEVLIFDLERERRLVAAVEIVSPANKDRRESRQLFVAKCFNLLRQDVCVSIIDLVTIRQFNLYSELLSLLERSVEQVFVGNRAGVSKRIALVLDPANHKRRHCRPPCRGEP
jgi:hypothetical protein